VAWWRSKFDLGYHVFTATEANESNAGLFIKPEAIQPADLRARLTATNERIAPAVFQPAAQHPSSPVAPMTPPDAASWEALAARGRAIALSDPTLSALRLREPEGASRTGFDIGIGIADNQTAWGPGKQALIDKLPSSEKPSAETAAHVRVDQNAKTIR
jgi:hypothetical protein